MPRPWTVTAFITMLVRVLRIAEFKHKISILDAIVDIYSTEGISTTEPIYKVSADAAGGPRQVSADATGGPRQAKLDYAALLVQRNPVLLKASFLIHLTLQ